jgi:hypothetical protein
MVRLWRIWLLLLGAALGVVVALVAAVIFERFGLPLIIIAFTGFVG